jgi:hypothetical protein
MGVCVNQWQRGALLLLLRPFRDIHHFRQMPPYIVGASGPGAIGLKI